jgi:RNA-directed DNA polymerase
VLADSPDVLREDGGGGEGPPDASERRAFLLHRAKRKRPARTVAWAADTSRLLEEVASEANLALALLNVVRNKGAPGIDGQTVEEAEAQAPKLLPRLRRVLLEGRYRPGDVRRVFIPKPGGGQRGLGIPMRASYCTLPS